jgi:hypothetical protein
VLVSSYKFSELRPTATGPPILVTQRQLFVLSAASMSVSAALKARVRRPSYLKKIAKAEDLIHHFPNDAYIVSAAACCTVIAVLILFRVGRDSQVLVTQSE